MSGGRNGGHAPHQERRDDGGAQAERSVGGEVERVVEPIADEDAERQRREDEADGRPRR